jgi:hypothetical protein
VKSMASSSYSNKNAGKKKKFSMADISGDNISSLSYSLLSCLSFITDFYRFSPICVVPIYALLESVLPAHAVDQLISSCGFGIRLRKLGVDRRSAVKSLTAQIKAVKKLYLLL